VNGIFPSKPTPVTSSYKSGLLNSKQAFNFSSFACCWHCQDNTRFQFRNSNGRYLKALKAVYLSLPNKGAIIYQIYDRLFRKEVVKMLALAALQVCKQRNIKFMITIGLLCDSNA